MTEWELEDAATCVAFRPNGQSLVTGHVGGRVLIWNSVRADVEQEVRLRDRVNTVVFSSDGSMLVTAAQDGFVRMTLVGHAELLAEAERRLTRTLTPAERLKFAPELSLL